MECDVIIIGAGLSGLTAAALLAKRGLSVTVIEAQYKPGGSCGIFKRNDVVFEQGAAMLYGFGEMGFNPHRFVFNALEEPIEVIKHDELYAINFGEHRIVFYEDMALFIEELVKVFPSERESFKRFYDDLSDLYLKVIAKTPVFTSPDIVKPEQGLKQLLSHPLAYVKFLGFMNQNTEHLLKKYFKTKEVFDFFDKLTSTYCYTTVHETPAILSSIMFVDNHFGGSYYPAGSTLNLVGKLEKVIESYDGKMMYNKEVEQILVEDHQVIGVKLDDGTVIYSKRVIHSGTVWNLYNKLIKEEADPKRVEWANSLVPTYPSLVLFALVESSVIPEDTLPIEMLVSDKTKIDEGELTAYLFSLDDSTLCPPGYQTVICIGPSFKEWPKGFKQDYHTPEYEQQKEFEQNRVLDVLERRFPSFKEHLIHVELSTPSTLNRYVLKEGGAVAGPKQQLGQHMLKRLKVKGDIQGLYHCGESTVMGTGTPAVTVSGVSAANLILRELNKQEFEYQEGMKEFVTIVEKPYRADGMKVGRNEFEDQLAKKAMKCQYCEDPICEKACPYHVPIRDINRRLSVGNVVGVRKIMQSFETCPCEHCERVGCEKACIRGNFAKPVQIHDIMTELNPQ